MEKRKRNALEVTSIGRLYQGPWEKRYWSSSRGKDRYPYPVGYQAVRSHNGHTYQMEVKEGARGPLFVVTLGEGVTCCAETPNIAWENAMKKESPRSKKMQGRLSNVTSDGAELFGFLNPLVQRLLRELVSSHDGEAQPSNETFKSSEKLDTAVSGRLSKVSIERAVPTSLSWSSSGSLSVRKSRTSIVNSGSGHPVMEQRAISFKKQTKKPASSDPSQSANNILLNKDVQAMGIQQKCYSKHSTVKSKDTNQGCVSPARFQARMSKTGGRKCLKLAKPAKKSEDILRPENDAGVKEVQSNDCAGNSEEQEVNAQLTNGASCIPSSTHKATKSSQLQETDDGINVRVSSEELKPAEEKNRDCDPAFPEGLGAMVPDSFDDLSFQTPTTTVKAKAQVSDKGLYNVDTITCEARNGILSKSEAFTSLTGLEHIIEIPDTYDGVSSQQFCGRDRGVISLSLNVHENARSSSDCICSHPKASSLLCANTPPQGVCENLEGGEKPQLMNCIYSSKKDELVHAIIPDSFELDCALPPTKAANEESRSVEKISCMPELVPGNVALKNQTVSNGGGSNVAENSESSEEIADKGESDSLGQELTTSMITLLLPQAVKLLKKKRTKNNTLGSVTVHEAGCREARVLMVTPDAGLDVSTGKPSVMPNSKPFLAELDQMKHSPEKNSSDETLLLPKSMPVTTDVDVTEDCDDHSIPCKTNAIGVIKETHERNYVDCIQLPNARCTENCIKGNEDTLPPGGMLVTTEANVNEVCEGAPCEATVADAIMELDECYSLNGIQLRNSGCTETWKQGNDVLHMNNQIILSSTQEIIQNVPEVKTSIVPVLNNLPDDQQIDKKNSNVSENHLAGPFESQQQAKNHDEDLSFSSAGFKHLHPLRSMMEIHETQSVDGIHFPNVRSMENQKKGNSVVHVNDQRFLLSPGKPIQSIIEEKSNLCPILEHSCDLQQADKDDSNCSKKIVIGPSEDQLQMTISDQFDVSSPESKDLHPALLEDEHSKLCTDSATGRFQVEEALSPQVDSCEIRATNIQQGLHLEDQVVDHECVESSALINLDMKVPSMKSPKSSHVVQINCDLARNLASNEIIAQMNIQKHLVSLRNSDIQSDSKQSTDNEDTPAVPSIVKKDTPMTCQIDVPSVEKIVLLSQGNLIDKVKNESLDQADKSSLHGRSSTCPKVLVHEMDASEASDVSLVEDSMINRSSVMRNLSFHCPLEPKVCLEHPMPILAMKVNFYKDKAVVLVCCGFHNTKSRNLFLYEAVGNECRLSLINAITVEVSDTVPEASDKEMAEENGIQLTFDGHELILLDMFRVNETREDMCAFPESYTDAEVCGVTVFSFANDQVSVLTRLKSCIHMFCVVSPMPHLIVSGGERGHVCGWYMDSDWRTCKESFTLPAPLSGGCQLSHVYRLLAVPIMPSIIIGCDNAGSIVIWDVSRRQLLSAFKISAPTPCDVQVFNLRMRNQPNYVHELSRRFTSENGGREEKCNLVGSMSFLVSIHSEDKSDLATKTGLKWWRLALLRRDGSISEFVLDQMNNRVSAVQVRNSLGIAGTVDGYVYLWDTVSGSCNIRFDELQGVHISCIASDSELNILAVGGNDGRVLLYMRRQ